MSPEVAAAVGRFRQEGLLSEAQASLFSRVAEGGLVSVRAELRILLYGGVLLITAGVGLLVGQNLNRLGPVAIAIALCLAATACLLWVARQAVPFSRGEVASPHLAFEYLLLLGVLLAGADLAYVEAHFTPLGPRWPWHLLLVGLFTGLVAFRFDSRLVFSLSLSSFAAWRGVSVSLRPTGWLFGRMESDLRGSAILCGLVFLLLGAVLVRSDVKAHFEPVAAHLGWLLILAALLSGCGASDSSELVYSLALLLVGGGLAAGAIRSRRFSLFGIGTLAAYAGLSALFFRLRPTGSASALWFLVSAMAVLFGLLRAHRFIREET
jgi:hypothetical protein